MMRGVGSKQGSIQRLRGPRLTCWAVGLALTLLVSSFLAFPSGAGAPSAPRAPTAATVPAAPAFPGFGPSAHTVGSGATPGPATGAPAWHNITRTSEGGAPPATFWGSAAYDAADHETVAFGGCSEVQCPENLTWVFADGVWTNITDPHDAPPARAAATMTYDPNMGGILLFGGVGVRGYLDDTWLFSGGVWTNVTYVSPPPPGRVFAGIAFDPEAEENGTVLFGGYNLTLGDLNDTWIWQGWSGWVKLDPAVDPPAADTVAMAYDPVDAAVVLYGAGFTSSTWELYSGQWWNLHVTAPPYRGGASMVYDPAQGSDILFGGSNGSVLLNDVWAFAHGAWSSLSFGTGPNGRALAALTLDPSGTVPFLYAGTGGAMYRNDTWVYSTVPTASIAASPTPAEVTTAVTFTATVSSGTAPYHVTIHFGDNSTEILTGNGPTFVALHSFSSTGSFRATVTVNDSAGLEAQATAPNPVVVTAGPSIAATATPEVVDVGAAVALSATAVVPGTAPITYAWKFGDGNSGAGANVSHTYAHPGTYSISVTGTDHGGLTSNASLTVVVNPLPTLTIGVNRTTTRVGFPVTFYANLSGGTSPYRYAWNFEDGNRSGFPAPTHVFGKAGNFTVQVWTNDSFDASDHQSIRVSVRTPTGGPPPPPPVNHTTNVTVSNQVMPDWFYPGVGGVAAVGAVGAGLLVWRMRSGKR